MKWKTKSISKPLQAKLKQYSANDRKKHGLHTICDIRLFHVLLLRVVTVYVDHEWQRHWIFFPKLEEKGPTMSKNAVQCRINSFPKQWKYLTPKLRNEFTAFTGCKTFLSDFCMKFFLAWKGFISQVLIFQYYLTIIKLTIYIAENRDCFSKHTTPKLSLRRQPKSIRTLELK